ncbi:MAG: GNAT family N-acetyltransferase [Verrucomicrobiae bacterium]|nr:GNAT family N-acetyltransferase [Verrucomicrobiae bacterium]
MKLDFQTMTRSYAAQVVSWRYEEPYDIYGYAENEREKAIEDLANEENGFYAVLNDGVLIAFRSYGKDGRVLGGAYDEHHLDTGGGLRPDLTGKGLGSKVIIEGLRFGAKKFGTKRFRVTIADFNERAKKACEKIGFRPSDRFLRTGDNKPFTVYTIEIKEENQSVQTTRASARV